MNPPEPSMRNRRLAKRRPPKRSTKITCRKGALGIGPNLALSLLDVSETGIRLVVKEDLKVRQEVEIGLLGIGHQRPIQIMGDVVWCVPAADGNHCLGVKFQRFLSYTDLQQLT